MRTADNTVFRLLLIIYCTLYMRSTFKERSGGMVWGGAEVAAVVLAVTLGVTLTLLIALLAVFIYERRSPLIVYSADPSWTNYSCFTSCVHKHWFWTLYSIFCLFTIKCTCTVCYYVLYYRCNCNRRKELFCYTRTIVMHLSLHKCLVTFITGREH